MKPDIIVVYDRFTPGPDGGPTQWMSATAPSVTVKGDSFLVQQNKSRLRGRVLLPAVAKISTVNARQTPPFDGLFGGSQGLLLVKPEAAQQDRCVEYLVAMRVGGKTLPALDATALIDAEQVGVRIGGEAGTSEIRFRRRGALGGSVQTATLRNGRSLDLTEGVEDTYRHWPQHKSWTKEERFSFFRAR